MMNDSNFFHNVTTQTDPFDNEFLKFNTVDPELLYIGMAVSPNRGFKETLVQKFIRLFGALVEICPFCKKEMIIQNANKWRQSGASLICDLCADRKADSVVDNKTREYVELDSDYHPKGHKTDYGIELINEKKNTLLEKLRKIENLIVTNQDNPWLYVSKAFFTFELNGWNQSILDDLNSAVELARDNPYVYAWRGFFTSFSANLKENAFET